MLHFFSQCASACKSGRIRPELPHRLGIPVSGYACPYLFTADIQPGSIGIHQRHGVLCNSYFLSLRVHGLTCLLHNSISISTQTRSGPSFYVNYSSGSVAQPRLSATIHCITPEQNHSRNRADTHQCAYGLNCMDAALILPAQSMFLPRCIPPPAVSVSRKDEKLIVIASLSEAISVVF